MTAVRSYVRESDVIEAAWYAASRRVEELADELLRQVE
jgi:hypothetical protein